MTATPQYQAIIIGGGPAGLAAGIVLGRAGIATLLLERRSLPHAKVCGEGLMPVGFAALSALGVHIPESQSSIFRGIRYVGPGGAVAEAQFAEGPGRGLPRRVLASELLRRARDYPALTLRDGVLCDSLRRIVAPQVPETIQPDRAADASEATGAYWAVRAGGQEYQAPLLIGADGLNSFVRQAVSLARETRRGDLRRWGARWHFPVPPWTDGLVEVHMAPGGGLECYVTPVGPAEVGLAFLWEPARYTPPHAGDQLWRSLVGEFPDIRARIAGLEPLPDGGAIGPLLRRVRSVVAEDVLLLGDAAGYMDAATGEGLSLAFAEALSLEESIVPYLLQRPNRGARATRQALRKYRRAYERITSNYYVTTRIVLWLGRRPALLDRVIAGLARSPGFFRYMLSANMGTRGLFRVNPWDCARFLWGALLHRRSTTQS